MDAVFAYAAMGVALVAAAWDIRTARIPNLLTYPALAGGLLLHLLLAGFAGLGTGLLGILVAGGIFFPFWLLRTLGAGDVKLMGALGAFAGPAMALQIVIATALAGGVLALFLALFRRRLRSTFTNLGELLRFHAIFGAAVHPRINFEHPEAIRMPYGVAIAAGTVYVCVQALR